MTVKAGDLELDFYDKVIQSKILTFVNDVAALPSSPCLDVTLEGTEHWGAERWERSYIEALNWVTKTQYKVCNHSNEVAKVETPLDRYTVVFIKQHPGLPKVSTVGLCFYNPPNNPLTPEEFEDKLLKLVNPEYLIIGVTPQVDWMLAIIRRHTVKAINRFNSLQLTATLTHPLGDSTTIDFTPVELGIQIDRVGVKTPMQHLSDTAKAMHLLVVSGWQITSLSEERYGKPITLPHYGLIKILEENLRNVYD